MVPKVAEYLDGRVSCKLIIDGKTIIKDKTNKAAVEIIGDTDTLVASIK